MPKSTNAAPMLSSERATTPAPKSHNPVVISIFLRFAVLARHGLATTLPNRTGPCPLHCSRRFDASNENFTPKSCVNNWVAFPPIRGLHGFCLQCPLIARRGRAPLGLQLEFSMRPSPSIVPGIDRETCLVLDDFGPIGRAWSEINVEDTDFETVITNLLDRRFNNPVRVVAFNTAEGWSRDVSEVVAMELRVRCANQGRELPESLQQFVERYERAKA